MCCAMIMSLPQLSVLPMLGSIAGNGHLAPSIETTATESQTEAVSCDSCCERLEWEQGRRSWRWRKQGKTKPEGDIKRGWRKFPGKQFGDQVVFSFGKTEPSFSVITENDGSVFL